MASISLLYSPNPKSLRHNLVYFNNKQLCTLAFQSSLTKFSRKSWLSPSTLRTRPQRVSTFGSNLIMAASHSFDVVIIGAGIIGLTIARQFLTGSDLSVAVVDKDVPCSGATGAGQGYIWMAHKTPGDDTWDLTRRSHKLWAMLAESVSDQGLDPQEVLGWKKTGSLLVGETLDESIMLQSRVKKLSEAGLKAEYLSSSELLLKEPALLNGNDGGAAFLIDDCQLDAHRTVAYIEKANRQFASEDRYAEFYHEPVTCLLRSDSTGEVEAVQTSKNILYGKKAIIVAAGCWTGSLMHDLLKGSNIMADIPVKPRKGHLLVIENFKSFSLNHGLMEVGYADHQGATLSPNTAATDMDTVKQSQMLSISMTATMDAMGNLVLGSSRQFTGFSTEADESIILHIWNRAADFFPKLRELSLEDFIESTKVRVGLRPYMPDSKPLICPVPGLSKVFLATGHEGGGLSMALGTAELIADMVLGNPLHVDGAPFVIRSQYL